MSVFTEGDEVLLHDQKGRRYRVRLRAGQTHSLHSGTIAHDALLGEEEGTVVATNRGARLLALRLTYAEEVTERRRRAQPIYPKDLGAILLGADLKPGLDVFECGTGTAALTIAAWRAISPGGRLVSYEAREEFGALARAAIEETLGAVPEGMDLRIGSVPDGVTPEQVGGVDRVLLDLPEPWTAVPLVLGILRRGGLVFALCPNVSQVQRYADGLRDATGFGLIEITELLERHWTVRGRSMRPSHRMVAHTGFLVFAHRIADGEVFEAEREVY
ncbi:MAG: tRNA (adenine-N1)-methyltransferase [Candidatus Dormibacteraceae bacterium]